MRDRWRDPVLWTDLLQLVKAVAAATLAWVLAVRVFRLSQPFLAPWAALLTVNATVYRSMARGVQQAGAAVVGVLLAFAAGATVGVTALSLAATVFLALLAGSTRGLRAESTTAAATALVVMTTGYSDDGGMVLSRLLDTATGIAVGLAVTLVVWPPLRDRSAARQIDVIDDRIGALLAEMSTTMRAGRESDEVASWIDRTRELDDDINRARGVVREARESGRLNLRAGTRPRMHAAEDFVQILHRLEQAVAEMRSIARTVERAAGPWSARFQERWIELLGRAGEAIGAANVAGVREVCAELDTLSGDLADEGLPTEQWPVYGALIVNLRNIAESMDAVAGAQPVRVSEPALAAGLPPSG